MNRTRDSMDTIISNTNKLFEEANTIINNTMNIDKEITTELNKSQVGTLQGIARQTIKDIVIVPNQDDVAAQAVLEQPYDERADIDINRNENTGRKKRKTNKENKTNKKSRKTNKKSRKNKYKY